MSRELAALIAGVKPVYRQSGMSEQEIWDWVEKEDLIRRNLTPSQRAAVAVEFARLNPHGINRFFRENKAEVESSREDSTTMTNSQLADKAQVRDATIERVRKVKEDAPELLPAVKEGTLTANEAAKVADLPKPACRWVASGSASVSRPLWHDSLDFAARRCQRTQRGVKLFASLAGECLLTQRSQVGFGVIGQGAIVDDNSGLSQGLSEISVGLGQGFAGIRVNASVHFESIYKADTVGQILKSIAQRPDAWVVFNVSQPEMMIFLPVGKIDDAH